MFQRWVLAQDLLYSLESVSHAAALQGNRLHRSVLPGFGTCHEFWNELMTRNEVPPYFLVCGCIWGLIGSPCVGMRAEPSEMRLPCILFSLSRRPGVES